jgi:DNA-binding MarR family transcriptional regulator
MSISNQLPDVPTAALLRLAYNLLSREIFAAVAAAGAPGMRPSHGNVMEHLSYEDGARLRDLAERASITPQSMGELVDELERAGYVERRPDPSDRRAKRIYLTRAGRRSVKAAGAAVLETEARLTQVLGPGDYGRLRRLLDRVIEAYR